MVGKHCTNDKSIRTKPDRMMSSHNIHRERPSPAQRLAELWEIGQPVDLVEFLKDFEDLPIVDLISIVLVDQREQWKSGNIVLVEDYFSRFSWIETDPAAAMDLIYSEYLLREQTNHVQSELEFTSRFPAFAHELSLQLQVHRLVDSQEFASQLVTQIQSNFDPSHNTPLDDSLQIAWQREQFQRNKRRLPEISGYQLFELVGQGGMGAVYRGWHQKLNRQVAIKVVQSMTWSDASSRERFEAEARATARLNHPNIVQIYEVGEIDNQLFLSLEYCRGGSLNGWLNGTPLAARQAAELTLPICQAVHHAHQRGIIHRDLKTANIVLQLNDDEQIERISPKLQEVVPKVTDFGLARNSEELGITRTDALVGTPSYMSPEQARGVKNVTLLSDVYSLGAILYEMLTGRPPFKGASAMETVRQVINDEPVSPMQFHPRMPRDLQTICLKALEKEPGKRYASALEFAEDLRRFLDGSPIKARPVSRTEKAFRWARRNPGWASTMALLVVMLIGAWQLTMINVAQTRESLEDLRNEQARTLAQQHRAENALEKAEQGLYLANITQANTAWNSLSMSSVKSFLDRCPARLRSWEWNYLNKLNNRRVEVWRDEKNSISSLAWDPINQHVATANLLGQICIYRITDPKPLTIRQFDPLQRLQLAFLNRGEKLFYLQGAPSKTLIGSRDTQVGLIDHNDSAAVPYVWAPEKPYGISGSAVCPQHNLFAIALLNAEQPSLPGIIKIFSSENSPPAEIATLDMPTAGCRFISYSPDGRRLAVAGEDKSVFILDTANNTVLDTIDVVTNGPVSNATAGLKNVTFLGKKYNYIDWGVDQVRFSPDGKLLAIGMYHGVVKVWDTTTKQLVFVLQCEDDHLSHLQFSEDNMRLTVVPTYSAVVHLYELQFGRKFAAYQGHTDRVSGVAFLNNGDLITSGFDSSLRRWGGSDQSNNRVLVGHTQSVLGVAFHPNGKLLATGDGSIVKARSPSKICLWNLESLSCERQVELNYSVGTMRYNPGGSQLAVACGDSAVRIFSETMEMPQVLKGHSYSVTSLDWNPKAEELVSVSGSLLLAMLPGEAIVWDTRSMQKRLKLVGHSAALSSVAYSPDGRVVITGSADKTVKVWDSATGRCLTTLTGPEEPVLSLVYDPHGRWIAAGTGDVWNPTVPKPGEIYIWNTATWQLERVLRGHSQLVHGLGVTSDGNRLISCARNDKVRLWDPETGTELLALSASDFACGICFSPNDQFLAVPNWSGKIDLFSADKAREIIR